MIGQVFSLHGKKYNVIILAGGNGSRMGEASKYIPKAMSQIGEKKGIDYIIERHLMIAHKFIIGVGKHGDIIENYVKGRFPGIPIEFSREIEIQNNAISFSYCLDHVDSDYGVIISFCDLIMLSNAEIEGDELFYVDINTLGITGTFRHQIDFEKHNRIFSNIHPLPVDKINNGLIGYFTFNNTFLLKMITYEIMYFMRKHELDLTKDIVKTYQKYYLEMKTEHVNKIVEFGTMEDLEKVRKLWEKI